VLLEYEGGQNYGEHCGGESRRTLIMMICSPGEKQVCNIDVFVLSFPHSCAWTQPREIK